eukprot:snap_masked-scaffold_5-processed-gene-11.22-mRNA-1 protein AED:1.00 eAED:1.00 QI:0/-1/0/0/-1/1/1/0/373
MVLLFFLALLLNEKLASATQCFQACYDCFVESTHPCFNKCGYPKEKEEDSTENIFPGYVVTTCNSNLESLNKCIYLEFFNIRPNGQEFILAQPFGCLSDFYVNETSVQSMTKNNIGSVHLEKDFNVFSCEGNFCNSPPPDIPCDASQALSYTASSTRERDSPCIVLGGQENFVKISFNKLRGGTVQNQVLNSGCVQTNEEDLKGLKQYNSSATCFQGFENACELDSLPEVVSFESCNGQDIPTFVPTFVPSGLKPEEKERSLDKFVRALAAIASIFCLASFYFFSKSESQAAVLNASDRLKIGGENVAPEFNETSDRLVLATAIQGERFQPGEPIIGQNDIIDQLSRTDSGKMSTICSIGKVPSQALAHASTY